MRKISIILVSVIALATSVRALQCPYGIKRGIASVVESRKEVLAVTEEGLFVASKSDHIWKKLVTPKEMPPYGQLVLSKDADKNIYYFSIKKYLPAVLKNQPDSDKWVYGLYVTGDNGRHWRLVNRDYDFESVFIHPNGVFYALAFDTKSKSAPFPNIILMSTNKGESWKDITTDGLHGFDLLAIEQDPVHPSLIIVDAWGIRGYTLFAKDNSYQWESEMEWMYWKEHEKDAFFKVGPQVVLYTLCATLDNYFKYDFGSQAVVCQPDMKMNKSSYRFKLSGPKIISIKLSYLREDGSCLLLDSKNGDGFWGIKIEAPDGDKTNARLVSADEPKDYIRTKFSYKQPYLRNLDLDRYYKFKKTGKYTMQVYYDNLRLADPHNGEDHCEVTGSTFTVNIR